MGHFCKYTSKVSIKWNQVVLEVVAHWKNKSEIVYRETEKGLSKCHYIYYNSMSGYIVTFPGEKLSYYYGYSIQEEEPLYTCKPFRLKVEWENAENDLKEVIEKRPDLKYIVQKYNCNKDPYEFMKIIRKYSVNPHIEYLIENGLTNLATDKRLEKLSKKKLSEVMNWVKNQDCDIGNITLTEILFCIKYNVSPSELSFYAQYHYQYDLANYYSVTGVIDYNYQKYIKVCKKIGKNLKDKYWKYPNDFYARWEQVIEEEKVFDEAQELAKKEREKKKLANKYKKFSAINKSTEYNTSEIDGYSIYVPSTVNDVIQQADTLNQCLITCDYIKKMAKGESILIFIKKSDERIATAEIDYNKKLLQFYGNEDDHDNCTPSKKVRNALDSWLSSLVITKRKGVALAQ